MHGLMVRVWMMVLSRDEFQPVAEDGAAAAADDALGRPDDEEAFKRQRRRRASRVRVWMGSEVTQLWSAICLYITAPLARLLGHYLVDEYMYVREQPEHAGGGSNPWADPCQAERRAPTLKGFVQGKLAILRQVQTKVVALISGHDGAGIEAAALIRSAFPGITDSDVFGAMQQMSLEVRSMHEI